MNELVDTKKINSTDNMYVKTQISLKKAPVRTIETSEMVDILRAEGGESLFNYSEWLGVTNEPDFIVLSSHHHYYYDEEELRNISTIITVKKINQIKNLGEFFETIFRLLPSGSKLIGSFSDNRRNENIYSIKNSPVNGAINKSEALENGIITRNPFLNMVFSFFDSRTNKTMSKDGVNELLRSHGFKVLDMTDLDGLTYFYAQKVRVVTE
jgi:hypothetical protein